MNQSTNLRTRTGTARHFMQAGLVASALTLASGLPAYSQSGTSVVQNFIRLACSTGTIFNQAAQFMDFEEMSRRALGPSRWAKMSAEKRREFVATFKRVMEQKYYPRWHRLFLKGSMDYVAESIDGRDVLVRTNLKLGRKTDALTWRLTSGGAPRIVSLSVGKKDLLTKASARLRKSADEKGTDGMIAWLKKKTKEASSAKEPFETTN